MKYENKDLSYKYVVDFTGWDDSDEMHEKIDQQYDVGIELAEQIGIADDFAIQSMEIRDSLFGKFELEAKVKVVNNGYGYMMYVVWDKSHYKYIDCLFHLMLDHGVDDDYPPREEEDDAANYYSKRLEDAFLHAIINNSVFKDLVKEYKQLPENRFKLLNARF